MGDITVLYITANSNEEVFEQKVRERLLEVIGDRPLISVSQKPLDFGHNICVGEVGASYRNAYIQLHIGASQATTSYIAIAEADQLYPPGYFDLEPKDDLYGYGSTWVVRSWDRWRFYAKQQSDWAVIVRKEMLIGVLEHRLKGDLTWGSIKVRPLFHHFPWTVWDVGLPLITFKARGNINKKTGLLTDVKPVHELPHWGRAKELSRYLGEY